MIKIAASALVGAFLLPGCGSFTHFQSARSLDAGKIAYDLQGSSIAMNEGTHFATRFRVGLGKGFEVGGESDLISLVLLEGGVDPSGFGLIMGDLKYQVLREPVAGVQGGDPFSLAVGAGGGSGFLTDFYFGQVTVSRTFVQVEPYLAWRYQRIHLDLDLNDPDDREDLEDSYLRDVFREAQDTRFGLHHIFVGVKIWLTKEIYLIPEASLIFGDADGVGSVGICLGFQTP
jgi:hypothetical protein